jgi:hypothetical protein
MLRMGSGRRRGRHYVDGCRVGCPHSPTGDVDVERCLGCMYLAEEHLSEKPAWIRCEASLPWYERMPISPPHMRSR